MKINQLPKRIILYGGTGQAKVVRSIAEHYGAKIVAVFDDTPNLPPFPDVPIYEGWEQLLLWLKNSGEDRTGFCVTIGNPNGHARLAIHNRLKGLQKKQGWQRPGIFTASRWTGGMSQAEF